MTLSVMQYFPNLPSVQTPRLRTIVYALILTIGLCYMVDIANSFLQVPATDRRVLPQRTLRKTLSCFILTLNQSLLPVQLKENITCHPFLGLRTDAAIFSHVDAGVQDDLKRGLSSRGAHYTNNNSVSIAWNHLLLWHKLLLTDGSQDLLIFEDDAIITNHSVDVYRSLQNMGLFYDNYIIKLMNHPAWWFGTVELSTIQAFQVNGVSHVLKKCTCRTRQSMYNTGAYVLDRRAAQILIDKFMPMRFHVDVYVHYTGYEFSNLFVVEDNVVKLSDRISTHQTKEENYGRLWPDFKELFMNVELSDC